MKPGSLGRGSANRAAAGLEARGERGGGQEPFESQMVGPQRYQLRPPSPSQHICIRGTETQRKERLSPRSCSSSRHHLGLPSSHGHEGWPGFHSFCNRLSGWELPVGPRYHPSLAEASGGPFPLLLFSLSGILGSRVSLHKPSIYGTYQPVGKSPRPLAERGLVMLLLISESPDVISDSIFIGLHWLGHLNQRLLCCICFSYTF